jgi:4-hydroxy-3-methylbut-2-en-1-yl diphosphate synthase IspG/GcpE
MTTEIIVPAHGGRFANECAGLRTKLVELVAERENLPIRGDFRPAFYRSKAEQLVDASIDAYRRNPGSVTDDEIGAGLEAMRDNYQAWQISRQAGIDARAKLIEGLAEASQAAKPVTHHTIRFTDSNSGRQVEITLPVDQVRFIDEAAA